MYVLNWFGMIIKYFRNITFPVFNFNISLFDLLFGTLILTALCKLFIKYLLESRR